ncbi:MULTISPECIES: hypothetical protein [Arsenophonus]|jgi:uncharacterized protein YneF (UPF0154 family)|nr:MULTISPECIES: hypothetical protein [Arsenophonus]UBX30253.1 hypothetical protein LDL57_06550 [Arsenophonus apicola]
MQSLSKISTIITILIGLNSTITMAKDKSQNNPEPHTNEDIVNSVLQSGSNIANKTVRTTYNTVEKANTAAN